MGEPATAVRTRTAITVTVPMPDHRLAANRVRTNPHTRHRLAMQHKHWASLAALVAIDSLPMDLIPTDGGPIFPAGINLTAWIAVERRKRGQRWDLGGLVEALKPAFDGMSGLIYADDRQVGGVIVEWDTTPTGTGLVHLTFVPTVPREEG